MPAFFSTITDFVTKAARPLAIVAGGLCLAVAAFLAADVLLQLTDGLPWRLVRGIGKGFGEVAGSMAAAAAAYYVIREIYVRLLRQGFSQQAWAADLLKAGLAVFRLLHPALGLTASALALAHGYLMWKISGGLAGGPAVATGLVLIAAAAVLAVFGGWLAVARSMLSARTGHRLAAFAAALLFAIHKVIAD